MARRSRLVPAGYDGRRRNLSQATNPRDERSPWPAGCSFECSLVVARDGRAPARPAAPSRGAPRTCSSTASPRTRGCGTAWPAGWPRQGTTPWRSISAATAVRTSPTTATTSPRSRPTCAGSSPRSGPDFERPILAGQSWGATVVLDFAVRYPDLTRGIVLVDGGLTNLGDAFPSWERVLAAPRAAAAGRHAALERRGLLPDQPRRLAGGGDRGLARQLRDPARPNHRALALARQPPADPAGDVGAGHDGPVAIASRPGAGHPG